MWMKLLQYSLSFILGRLMDYLKDEWEDSNKEKEENEKKRQEIKKKVKAIKDAKTKAEIRVAIRDLSI